jgi:hypothetical protein
MNINEILISKSKETGRQGVLPRAGKAVKDSGNTAFDAVSILDDPSDEKGSYISSSYDKKGSLKTPGADIASVYGSRMSRSGLKSPAGINGSGAECDLLNADRKAASDLTALTGEDVKGLSGSGNKSIKEYNDEALERAIKRIKEQKETLSAIDDKNHDRQKLQDSLRVMGAINSRGMDALKSILASSGCSADKASVQKTAEALEESRKAYHMTDGQKKYLIGNDLEPTIRNIYEAAFSKESALPAASSSDKCAVWETIRPQAEKVIASSGLEVKDAGTSAEWLFENDLPVTGENIQKLAELDKISDNYNISDTIDSVIHAAASGKEPADALVTDDALKEAVNFIKQLHDFNGSNVDKAVDTVIDREEKQGNIDPADVKEAMISLSASAAKVQTDAGSKDSSDQAAVGLYSLTRSVKITVTDIRFAYISYHETVGNSDFSAASGSKAGDKGSLYDIDDYLSAVKEFAAGTASDDPEEQFRALVKLKTRRQLEEMRLKFTISSYTVIKKSGLNADTSELGQIVDALRDQEARSYGAVSPAVSGSIETISAFSETQSVLYGDTLDSVYDIGHAPAKILAMSDYRRYSMVTVGELRKTAVNAAVGMQKYMDDFEAVSTEVRTDLGDSLEKAFRNSGDILKDLGFADTDDNRRAIRILGSAGVSITRESVEMVRSFDLKVNKMIRGMTPENVLDMIRSGKNPLDMTVDEVNDLLSSMKDPALSDERYADFLVKLDHRNGITEKEKDAYKGIYRLLNTITQHNSGALGRVLDMGQAPTLRNILRASKTIGKDIDVAEDTDFGGLLKLVWTRPDTVSMIDGGIAAERSFAEADENAAAENMADGSNASDAEIYESADEDYLSMKAGQLMEAMEEGNVLNAPGSDHDPEDLLDISLESFTASESINAYIKEDYFSSLSADAVKYASDENVKEYLEKFGIATTVGNMISAGLMSAADINGRPVDPYEKTWKRLNQRGQIGSASGAGDPVSDDQTGEDTADIHADERAVEDSLRDSELEAFNRLVDQVPDALESPEKLFDTESAFLSIMKDLEERTVGSSLSDGSMLSSALDLRSLTGLMSGLSRRYSYDLPVRTSDGVMNMNVTYFKNTDRKNRLSISVPDPENGYQEMKFTLFNRSVNGIIYSENRAGLDKAEEKAVQIKESLEKAGFSVSAISATMSRTDRLSSVQDKEKEGLTPAAELFKLSSIIVKTWME